MTTVYAKQRFACEACVPPFGSWSNVHPGGKCEFCNAPTTSVPHEKHIELVRELRAARQHLAELMGAASRVVGAYTLSVYPPTSSLVTDSERHDSLVALHALLRALASPSSGGKEGGTR